MSNRELLMLANVYKPDKSVIANWFASIKLDGQRCFWDGGVSRGLPKRRIPWANNDRDDRYKEPPTATGLWSRYGNVIHAPEWFLNQLPRNMFLDGELYWDRGKFQETRKIISTIEPGAGWSNIKYKVFDIPSPHVFFTDGQINNPNFRMYISSASCDVFFDKYRADFDPRLFIARRFDETIGFMRSQKHLERDNWSFLNQVRLPPAEADAVQMIDKLLTDEIQKGGEGLILRSAASLWSPKRSQHVLKVKNHLDDECVIMGYMAGEGKFLGMIGSLLVYWGQKQFQLSGLTDELRRFATEEGYMAAKKNPGQQVLIHEARHFKKGQRIRFRYRELTDDGIPKEARYWE